MRVTECTNHHRPRSGEVLGEGHVVRRWGIATLPLKASMAILRSPRHMKVLCVPCHERHAHYFAPPSREAEGRLANGTRHTAPPGVEGWGEAVGVWPRTIHSLDACEHAQLYRAPPRQEDSRKPHEPSGRVGCGGEGGGQKKGRREVDDPSSLMCSIMPVARRADS